MSTHRDPYAEPRKSFNDRTGKWRVPWKNLTPTQRIARYRHAQVAAQNGLRVAHARTFSEFARAQRSLDRHQRAFPSQPRAIATKKRYAPHLFGRGGSDRALICLALNGPLTVRELARTVGMDAHAAFKVVERLRASGLVVKRDIPGSRKYVAVNRNLPIYRPLVRLLLALERVAPVARRTANISRWHMPFDRVVTSARLDRIFQSAPRSRVLLCVAAAGETNLQSTYHALGLDRVSTWLIVRHWETQGVLRTRRYKRHRLIGLDPSFIAAKELRALLYRIVACSAEYRALRQVVQSRVAEVVRAAGPWEKNAAGRGTRQAKIDGARV